jgi:hypothetical protein
VHRSSRGVFSLSSDAFTTRLGKRAGRVIREIPDDELPKWPGYTVGSAIVFPANTVDGKQTINFFDLFGDFRGYVNFFLLQDLVEDDGRAIRFFHPFADFVTPAVPKSKPDYLRYLQASNDFIRARNRRIAEAL